MSTCGYADLAGDCREHIYAPARTEIQVGVNNDFGGDNGALFASEANGATWRAIALPELLKNTVFVIGVFAHPLG